MLMRTLLNLRSCLPTAFVPSLFLLNKLLRRLEDTHLNAFGRLRAWTRNWMLCTTPLLRDGKW